LKRSYGQFMKTSAKKQSNQQLNQNSLSKSAHKQNYKRMMQIKNCAKLIENTPETNDALMKTPKSFINEVTPDKQMINANSSNFKTPQLL